MPNISVSRDAHPWDSAVGALRSRAPQTCLEPSTLVFAGWGPFPRRGVDAERVVDLLIGTGGERACRDRVTVIIEGRCMTEHSWGVGSGEKAFGALYV